MKKMPIIAVAALTLVAGLTYAATTSSGSAATGDQAPPSGTSAAAARLRTHVRHFVLTPVRYHRTSRLTFAGTDRIHDRASGKVVGTDRYTGRRNPHRHIVRLRIHLRLKHGKIRGVLRESRRSHRVRGRVTGGRGAYRGVHGRVRGHRAGGRTVLTLRYHRRSRAGGGGPTLSSSDLTRWPYLTDVVGGSATLNFATDNSVTAASATLGRAGGSCNAMRRTGSRTGISVGGASENQWRVVFTGLRPGKRYCYRIQAGTATDPGPTLLSARKASAFRTLPVRKRATFKFAVLGDWGYTDASGHNPGQADLDARIASSGALFAVGTGDTAYPSGSETNYGDLFQRGANVSTVFAPEFYKRIGDGIPMYNALGNHGLSASSTFTDLWPQRAAPGSSRGRFQMDTYGGVNGSSSKSYPSVWYAFRAGRVRIYVLDASWANSNLGSGTLYSDDYAAHWRPSSPEYRWLASDLAHHKHALKFAVMHFPMYADSPSEGTDTYLHGSGSLGELLTRYGVRLVFNGHMHAYQRNTRHHGESFVSYVTGGGGATLESVGRSGCGSHDAYAVGWSPTTHRGYSCGAAKAPTSASQVYHFLLVRVRRKTVTVRPTDSTGRAFDVHTYHF